MNEKNQRNTQQRQVVIEELRKLTSHPTATELYQVVRHRLPKISLGTVYRNLELLSQSGLIQKLKIGSREARFDGNPEWHCHVRCVRCGQVDDVHQAFDGLTEARVTSLNGYEIIGSHLEFLGICPKCKTEDVEKDD